MFCVDWGPSCSFVSIKRNVFCNRMPFRSKLLKRGICRVLDQMYSDQGRVGSKFKILREFDLNILPTVSQTPSNTATAWSFMTPPKKYAVTSSEILYQSDGTIIGSRLEGNRFDPSPRWIVESNVHTEQHIHNCNEPKR